MLEIIKLTRPINFDHFIDNYSLDVQSNVFIGSW